MRIEKNIKVRERAQIRNQSNQAPHLTQEINGKVTTSQLDNSNDSQSHLIKKMQKLNYVIMPVFQNP